MKKQTAVEWLISQMPDGVRQYLDDYKDVLTKAIEMDREQKESSWNAGHDSLSSLMATYITAEYSSSGHYVML